MGAPSPGRTLGSAAVACRPVKDIARKPYVYAGLALLAATAWGLLSAGGAIVNGHPSYWFLSLLAADLGLKVSSV